MIIRGEEIPSFIILIRVRLSLPKNFTYKEEVVVVMDVGIVRMNPNTKREPLQLKNNQIIFI